jgi:hypothetical protein
VSALSCDRRPRECLTREAAFACDRGGAAKLPRSISMTCARTLQPRSKRCSSHASAGSHLSLVPHSDRRQKLPRQKGYGAAISVNQLVDRSLIKRFQLFAIQDGCRRAVRDTHPIT